MQGKSKMNPDFVPLAQWIDQQYGVRTINILYDIIENGKLPRILICFEFEQEVSKFLNSDRTMNKHEQQAIAQAFAKTAGLQSQYPTANLWVTYGAFEPVAKSEAMSKITQEDTKLLQTELNDPNLWLIMPTSFGLTPVFFLYTDAQVKTYNGSETVNKWTDRFYALLKAHDEFDYFKRDDLSIYLDSKENFDTNYQSNWYYYFK